jgi:hypothetical protein
VGTRLSEARKRVGEARRGYRERMARRSTGDARKIEMEQLVRELEDAVVAGVDATKAWLDSPRGRRYREYAAKALVVSVPIILKHPFFKTPLGRVVEIAGGAALVAKVADVIKDWEPARVGSS